MVAELVNEPPLFPSLHQWELLNYVVADMHSDKSRFAKQGQMRKGNVPQDYFCNRASGVSARLPDQQSMRSENDAKRVSFFYPCLNVQLVPTTPDADDTF